MNNKIFMKKNLKMEKSESWSKEVRGKKKKIQVMKRLAQPLAVDGKESFS